jgi:type I restriction enzyme, S subunit
MVPEGWTKRRLGEFCTERTDRAGDETLPILSVTKDLGIVLQSERFRRRIASNDTSRYKRIRAGEFAYDPMLLWSGSIARQQRVDEGVISPAYYAFSIDSSIDGDFLEYFLKQPEMIEIYARISFGTNARRRKAQFKDFARLEFAFPHIGEQRQIADRIRTAEAAIRSTQAVLKQSRKVTEGLLQRLLTRGIGHTQFKQTEIGLLPLDWEVKRLDTVVPSSHPITYGIVQAGPDWPDGVPYVRVSDMGGHVLAPTGMLRTSPEIASRYWRSELSVGDIVYALRGAIGRVLTVPESLAGANLTQGTARISPGSTITSRFLLWAMRSRAMLDQAERAAKGSTFREISLAALRAMRVPVPSLAEQNQIATHLDQSEATEMILREELAYLHNLHRGLSYDLLTGRVRVPPPSER